MYTLVREGLNGGVSRPRRRTSVRARVSGTVLLLGVTSLLTDISSEMVAAILPLYLMVQLQLSPLYFGFIDGLYQFASVPLRLAGAYPAVHLFDEPQFNTQDGYIGFMLRFFRTLRARGSAVFVSLHPHEPYHVDILREISDRFVFVQGGRLTHAPAWEGLVALPAVRGYLGRLAE